ncbi:MAG TPA: four helix bundle protein [Chitinophagales bacterium]|nr:four helix bundle protein [Chitinophagales bacterium]
MKYNEENIILKLSYEFALAIIEYAEILEEYKKYIIARQILKSGTSIGANIKEAQNAESKSDFIHKIKIAAKEVDETEYWLELCRDSKNYHFDQTLLDKLIIIKKIINKIISTSKKPIS